MKPRSVNETPTLRPNVPPAASPEIDLLHWAAEYLDRGWSILPLHGKRPAIASWRGLQTQRPDLATVRQWLVEGCTNLGIITGQISDLVVIDCDTVDDAQYWQGAFPATPLVVTTGRGGCHFYYRLPMQQSTTNRIKLLQRQIDLRADGGYVVAPPSRHPNGTTYQWCDLSTYSLDEVPVFSHDWIAGHTAPGPVQGGTTIRSPRSYIRTILAVSGQGGHNQTYRVACKLREAGLTPEETLCELILWNETNATPPWTLQELLHKVQSAYESR